jgi:hypothetical protein
MDHLHATEEVCGRVLLLAARGLIWAEHRRQRVRIAPVFPAPALRAIPLQPRFLGRPRLLTRLSLGALRRDRTLRRAGPLGCLENFSRSVTGSQHQPSTTSQPAQRRAFYVLARGETRAGPFSCFVVSLWDMTALSQITENRKVEARRPLIFQHPIFVFCL